MGAVLGRVEVGDGLPRGAEQQPLLRFEECHLIAELAQDSRRFKADIAAADHDEARCRGQRGDQRIGIAAAADRIEARRCRAGARERTRRAAARPDELVIADLAAASGLDDMRKRIDSGDALAKHHRNVPFRPEGGGPQQDALERLLAAR